MDSRKLFVFCNILSVTFCIWFISSNKYMYINKLQNSLKERIINQVFTKKQVGKSNFFYVNLKIW